MKLRLEGISRSYRRGAAVVPVLQDLSWDLPTGCLTVLTGVSGSGKTTALMTLAGLLRPDQGRVWCDETDLYALSAERRRQLCARHFGLVFQRFHLLPYLDVGDNIRLSSLFDAADPVAIDGEEAGTDNGEARLVALLQRCGLESRRHHRPAALSVGEQQRVALARALYQQPNCLLADEPTGNLDATTTAIVLDLVCSTVAPEQTVLLISHDPQVIDAADQVVHLEDLHHSQALKGVSA